MPSSKSNFQVVLSELAMWVVRPAMRYHGGDLA